LTVHRLWRLIRQFPRESATARSVHGVDEVSWGLQEQLLAGISDSLSLRLWQAGRGKGRRPKPMPRPGLPGHKAEKLGTVRSLDEQRAKQKAWAEGRSEKVDRPARSRRIGKEAS
jgi:hypothetical protein